MGKLVRDKIPQFIEDEGLIPVTSILVDDARYRKALMNKLNEELTEFFQDPCEEELADILEVLKTLGDEEGLNWLKALTIQMEKRQEKGGFEGRVFLMEVREKGDFDENE